MLKMNKQELMKLESKWNQSGKKCENCLKKPGILHRPNDFVISGTSAPWEICRPCLDKLFTLSKTNKGVKND